MPASPRFRAVGDEVVGHASRALAASALVALMIVAMWALEVLDYSLDGRLDQYGLRAHDVDDLPNMFSAPFLHAGFDHLIGNTLPFAILGFLAAVRGILKFAVMNLFVIVIAGVGVWFTGPSSAVTLGASILVFGYFGYLVGRGLFERRIADALLAIVVLVLYGGILYGVLPTDLPISWQGHLFGLIGGLWSAYALRRRKRPVRASSGRPQPPGQIST